MERSGILDDCDPEFSGFHCVSSGLLATATKKPARKTMFDDIASRIHQAAHKSNKIAMFHLQVLTHARELANIDPVEFCHLVGVPESYATEFRKMLKLARLMESEDSNAGGTLSDSPLAKFVSLTKHQPRTPGLHIGAIRTAPDFDAPLPDDFWLGTQ
jgi:hypothetical protein